jgi:hypothetical protein
VRRSWWAPEKWFSYLDGVLGLIALFTTMEPILNGHFKNLNRSMANAAVGEWVGLVGKNLTQGGFYLPFRGLPAARAFAYR